MHSAAEWGAIVLGLLLIANGILWRQLHIRRRRRTLTSGLGDPDPAVRIATVEAMTSGGLSANAVALEGLTKTEQDPDVLETLARAVIRHQWEPANDPAMVQLRIWASNRSKGAGSPEPVAAAAPAADRPEAAADLSTVVSQWSDPEPRPPAAAVVPDPVSELQPVPGEPALLDPAVSAAGSFEGLADTAAPERTSEADQSPIAEPGVAAASIVEEAAAFLREPAWQRPGAPTELRAPPPPALLTSGSASEELVAASRPIAEAVANALGTTVRSLRMTTLEGAVTAQWPR